MTPPIAHACGKFILTGEHFILHDTPALVLPWRDASFSLFAPAPGERGDATTGLGSDVDDNVRLAWAEARTMLGLPPQTTAFPFIIDSTIPLGCGFGSSAALCVALLQAAAQEAGQVFTEAELIQQATELEGLFHGRSSGLDPTIAVIQQPLRFHMKDAWRPFSWTLAGYGFVLAVTRETRKTAVAVGRVTQFSEDHSSRFREMVLAMQDLIGHIEALAAGSDAVAGTSMASRAATLGPLLTQNHALLREVGVSSPHLEVLVEAALAAGALGAKLTGAGMGGGMLAFAPLDALPALSDALLRADARHCATCFPYVADAA